MKGTVGTPYYIAPEVIFSNYTERCDLWSIGIILFIMLCGVPPFDGPDDKEIIKSVRKGIYSMEPLKHCSKSAQDLIRHLIYINPIGRYSAEDALKHTWIEKRCNNMKYFEETAKALKLLRNNKSLLKMQEAIVTYVITNLTSP